MRGEEHYRHKNYQDVAAPEGEQDASLAAQGVQTFAVFEAVEVVLGGQPAQVVPFMKKAALLHIQGKLVS